MRLNRILSGLVVMGLGLLACPSRLDATPYASNVTKTGTTVNFLLNEPADTLTYKINGGAPISLDGTTKGAKTFVLGAATDTFSIIAEKNAAVGFTIPTGGMTPVPVPTQPGPPVVPGVEVNGLRIQQNLGGYSLISDESNVLTRFNSPRGVGVNTNPNTPNFGTAYIANSAAGALTVAPARTLTGEGVYALRSDGSDAFGQGDVGRNPDLGGLPTFNTGSSNSPYRVTVANTGEVYVADYADANSNVFVLDGNLTSSQNALAGFDGATTLPPGVNHGSILDTYTTGSLATGDLVLYTMDEDLTAQYFIDGTTPLPGTDHQSIWKYEIGSGPFPSTVTPTKIPSGLIGYAVIATADFDIGADGKIYTSQNRSAGTESGIFVSDSAGAPLWNSLGATRSFLGDPAANDILTNVTGGVAISPDQNWIATVINRSDVVVMPLVAGLPDISRLLVVDTTTTETENQGRDIAFDAAGNIHYVSSGQARYRVIAPGGHTKTTLSYDGSQYAFNLENIVANDADFNNDTLVDAADLAIWSGTFGGAATAVTGDANGDNISDGADFLLWQQQYKNAGAISSVPEPATWCSAIIAAMILATWAAPRRRTALQSVWK